MTRQIVALGGGGFPKESGKSLLDQFTLSLTEKSKPKVCLVPTASGDHPLMIEAFESAFPARRAKTSVLTLFDREVSDIGSFLGEQDVIYVGGGNTANMLQLWRLHGVDDALRSAYENGTVMTGMSAGMLCWFESGITDSFMLGSADPLYDGLGFLRGSACPHFHSEPARRPRYHSLIAVGFPAGHAADDNAALHFKDEKLIEGVADREGAKTYRITAKAGVVTEKPLPTRLLT